MLRKRELGFTMIELLISIAVIAFVVPALTMGVRNLIALNNRARDLAVANMVAENKAEEVRSAGFNSLSTGTVSFSGELPAELASPKSASYTVSTATAGLAVIDITISYKDYNTTKTLTYKTVVGELGVGQ